MKLGDFSELDTFGVRLRAARKSAGLTQEALGVSAGIDEFSASARMNQYERGKHWPDFGTACRIAAALGVDPAYFYARSSSVAELLLAFSRAKPTIQKQILTVLTEN